MRIPINPKYFIDERKDDMKKIKEEDVMVHVEILSDGTRITHIPSALPGRVIKLIEWPNHELYVKTIDKVENHIDS